MQKKNQHFTENTPGSNKAKEKLCLENEILRLKLKAECGSDFHHKGDIPPEVEHLFLKNILAFEEKYANAKLISVFDFLGQPVVKKADEIEDDTIEAACEEVIAILSKKNITVDFGNVTDPRLKYTFITQELFLHEINNIDLPGMFLHFFYEEFYPDHESDIRKRAIEFLSDWFERTMGKFSWELAADFVLPDGNILPKEKVLEKFRLIFDAYTAFTDGQYRIDKIYFELKEEEYKGLAHVDGAVKYNAVLENGEVTFIDGPFKLFLSMEHNCWRVFYFVFPGFEW